MVTFRDIVSGLRQFEVGYLPVIAHTWAPAFGNVRGGNATLLGGMMTVFEDLVMPAFTRKTMLIPGIGPEDNGIVYGAGRESNALAEFFHADLPVDDNIGEVSELLRLHPHSLRSIHPVLSFSGVNQDIAMQSQTIEEPLRPIGMLVEQNGWVVLMGTDHTENISIHFAELLQGGTGFTRWALTRNGVVECPGMPGCRRGFNQAYDLLAGVTRSVQIGEVLVHGIPLQAMMELLTAYLQENPLGLLCSNPGCVECNAVRKGMVKRAGMEEGMPGEERT